MEVKPGYKKTDLGVIPEDWHVKTLGDIGEALIGLTYKPADVRSHGTLVLRSSNIRNDALAFDDNVFVETNIPDRIKVRCDDVLICVRNGSRDLIGKSTLLDERTVGMTFGAFMAVYRSQIGKLASYLFQSPILKQQIKEHLGATINQITNKSLNSFRIPLSPQSKEIDAIATALNDVDALLAGLDRLIAKKRDLKQAAMQQLLTGQSRLPGFRGEWEEKKLEEYGTFLKGRGVTKDQTRSGNLACIRYGEIYTHHHNIIRDFNSWISPEVASTATRLLKGDVLFAGSGETKEEIGKCAAFVSDIEAYAGGDIVIFRPHNTDSAFLGYSLNTAPVNEQKASLGQGDAVVHISSSALAAIRIRLPTPLEQTAIATVLSDMDAELVALEQRRDKTRALKQVMLQELLTGKIRLIQESANTIPVEVFASKKQPRNQPVGSRYHNWQINEAVVVSVLVKHFGSEQFPLGRKRCAKLTYLMHRYVENEANGYLKKAAGPYNPSVKYNGPEKIAQKNAYIRPHTNGKYSGFVATKNIAKAEAYFDQWYGGDVLVWLDRFRYNSNDDLELLATVDMAIEDLKRSNAAVSVDAVKSIISNHSEWEAKLDRDIFSDRNIAKAITKVRDLFSLSE